MGHDLHYGRRTVLVHDTHHSQHHGRAQQGKFFVQAGRRIRRIRNLVDRHVAYSARVRVVRKGLSGTRYQRGRHDVLLHVGNDTVQSREIRNTQRKSRPQSHFRNVQKQRSARGIRDILRAVRIRNHDSAVPDTVSFRILLSQRLQLFQQRVQLHCIYRSGLYGAGHSDVLLQPADQKDSQGKDIRSQLFHGRCGNGGTVLNLLYSATRQLLA